MYLEKGLLLTESRTAENEVMALQLLHEMDYDYLKAKFYLFYPVLRLINKRMSGEQMKKMLGKQQEVLRESRENQQEKWVEELRQLEQTRVNVSEVNSHLEQGRLFKYPVPDSIRERLDRVNRLSKEIKKLLKCSNNPLVQLTDMQNKCQQQNIITKEMLQLGEEIQRVRQWKDKTEEFLSNQMKGKINTYKQLTGLVSEYNNLLVKDTSFEDQVEPVHSECQDIISQINSVSKLQKTRGNNLGEKMTLEKASLLQERICRLGISYDDFEGFLLQHSLTQQYADNCLRYIKKEDYNSKTLNNLIKEGQCQLIQCQVFQQLVDL